jgi:tetratricopeptide (TPR) repeat protein
MVLGTLFAVSPELVKGVVSGKYFWFYFSMGIIAITTVIGFICRQAIRIKKVDGLILLYGTGTLVISYFVHSSEAVTKHILFVLIILLYCYFRMILSASRSNKYRIMMFFLATGLVEAIWGLGQLYGFLYSQHSRFGLTGSFFNPGPYACYIAVVLPMAFFYTLKYRLCFKVKFHIRNIPIYFLWGISLLTFVLSMLVLPATMSRTSWIAALGGCGPVLIYFSTKNVNIKTFITNHKKKCILIIFITVLLIAAGCSGMYQLKKDSADGRLLTWKIALRTAVHHPWGVGIGNFSGSYGHEQIAYFSTGKGTEQEQHVAGNPEYCFNEYLQIAIEQGFVPFILFTGIMAYSLYLGIRHKRIAAAASLIAMLISAMASYPFSVLPFLIVMAFLLAWIHSGKCENIPKNLSVNPFSNLRGTFLFLPIFSGVFLCVVAGCLYNRYPTYQAYKQWGQSKELYHAGLYKSGIEAYAPLYLLLSDRLDFLFEYAQCLSGSEQYKESNEVLKKAMRISCDPMLFNVMGKNYQSMKQYADAEHCFREAAYVVPSRIYPWYLLANLYMETNDKAKAHEMARIVLAKEPKVQSTAIKEMRIRMKRIIRDSENSCSN